MMKKMIAVLAVAVLAASLASAQNTVRIIATTDIRSFSSADAPVIGFVPKGTVVGVVSRDGDWVQIKMSSGYPAFVPAVFCQFVGAAAPVQAAPAPAPQPVAAPVYAPPAPVYAPAPTQPSKASDVPAVEITAGYSFLYDGTYEPGSFPLGWRVSSNFNVTRAIGVVLDVSGNYNSEDALILRIPVTVKTTIYGLHGGLRFSARGASATPYLQVLAGITRESNSVLGISDSGSNFSIQPGLGVMFKVSDKVGVDVGGDYRLIFAGGETFSTFRAHVGVAFFVGKK